VLLWILSERGSISLSRQKQLRPILIIGRIGRAHALFGEFRVNPLTDDINRFIGLRNCLLLSPDEQRYQTVQVLSSRIVTNQVYVRLKGFESRELAESLRGRLLAVHREQAVKLPPDTWFICDLIGCDVFDATRGYLGILTEVVQNLAQDVYTITLEGQADLLLPAKKEFIQKVDLESRQINVNLPDGLYEIYR
jgi:16S rRNA processing protein RimM